MSIVFLMVVPLPKFALDLLLALSISLSVLIFLLGMYTDRPIDFSVFPSALLIITVFRLALNVSSTRLILTRGHEGPEAVSRIIAAFGDFVVGGNFVVGIVIFLILVIINFVVITKGATRIAEVSARFTLDSMPGKQMAIDADLNAGLIGEAEARERRREIAAEADFYGAMDGASKFVRGDAVAGLVITAINIVGGLVIGVLQRGMPLVEAGRTYTTLTVGDGLVSQMPALVVSTAAGLLVTRAGSQSNLGEVLPRQFGQAPAALGLSAAVLLALGLVPKLPFLPFAALAAVMGGTAWATRRTKEPAAQDAASEQALSGAPAAPSAEAADGPDAVNSLLHVDVLELEVGYGLLHLVDPAQGGDLLDRIRSIRRQTALETGIVVPPIRIRDNLQLRPSEYLIRIKGVEVGRGELREGFYLAMGAPGSRNRGGDPDERTRLRRGRPLDPRGAAAGGPGQRVHRGGPPHGDRDPYHRDHPEANAFELLGRQETQNLVEVLRSQAPAVVDELVPNLLPLGGVQKVLQNLLREQVSVRDLRTILETLADHAPRTQDPEILTEYVRAALGRSISTQYVDGEGRLRVIVLDHRLEDTLAEAVTRTDRGSFLSLEPRTAQQVLRCLGEAAEEVSRTHRTPVVLTPPAIRLPLRKLTERALPGLVVLSHDEVDGPLRTLKVVTLES